MASYTNIKSLIFSFSIITTIYFANPQNNPTLSPSGKQQPLSAPSPSPSQPPLFPKKEPLPLSESSEDFDIPQTLPSSVKLDSRLKEICDATDYPSLCLSSIAPYLRGKPDIPSVLEVAMKVGEKLSESALIRVQKLAKKPGASPELTSILRDCEDSYDTSLYNFQNALGAFPQRDIGTMNIMLSAVITDLADCDDAFKMFGEDFPLSSIAEKLANITSNCLAIITQLDYSS